MFRLVLAVGMEGSGLLELAALGGRLQHTSSTVQIMLAGPESKKESVPSKPHGCLPVTTQQNQDGGADFSAHNLRMMAW